MIVFVCMQFEMLCDMGHLVVNFRVGFVLVVVVWNVMHRWSSGKPPWAACRMFKKTRVSSRCWNMIVNSSNYSNHTIISHDDKNNSTRIIITMATVTVTTIIAIVILIIIAVQRTYCPVDLLGPIPWPNNAALPY